MEIGEMVKVALAAKHSKDDCPFCREEEVGDKENDLVEHDKEDEGTNKEASNYLKNKSGKLAQNLKNVSQKGVPDLENGEKSPILDIEFERAKKREWKQWIYDAGLVPMLYAAHHLIPGNASLRKSRVFKKLGIETGKNKKNVGYNVNRSSNGVWSAANYAVRPWSAKDNEFKKSYAFLAMHDSNVQFHDAHPTYSETVLSALNDLDKELNFYESKGCPVCKKGNNEDEPIYALNARLNAISGYLRGKLIGIPSNWRVKTLFTSEWAVKYYEYYDKYGINKLKKIIRDMRQKK